MFRILFIFSLNLLYILEPIKALNFTSNIIPLSAKNKNIGLIDQKSNSFEKSDKKNVIIGLIKGYTWSILKPFFISLMMANIKNYDLIIYIDKLSEDTLNKIKLCGAITREIPQKNLGYQDLMKLRWKLFSDFLKEKGDEYNLVFYADVKDVIFQKDIFKFYNYNKSFIGFTLEDITLRNPLSKNEVKPFCKNNQQYNEIADERVISGGTIIASVDKFIEFADSLSQTIENFTNIFDQGAINYLIYYEKLLNDSLILTDNNGSILTICPTERKKVMLDSDNNILNYKGKIAAIVHQYDRKPDIIRKINKKYSDDILNKYFELNKINEAKKVNEEYKAKMKRKKRVKIIRKIILISFIIISIVLIIYIRAKKSGLIKNNEKSKTNKIKDTYKKTENSSQNNLSTSENKIY